jgi:hypothetical protein
MSDTKEKLFNDLSDPEMLQYMLYDDKSSVGLNEFKSRISNLTMKNENGSWNDTEILEKTLSYLMPLLKEGKLKVRVKDFIERPLTKQEVKEKASRAFVSANERECDQSSQAEEAIADIRKRWNAIPQDEIKKMGNRPYIEWTEEAKRQSRDLSSFEQLGIIFTLPENNWFV